MSSENDLGSELVTKQSIWNALASCPNPEVNGFKVAQWFMEDVVEAIKAIPPVVLPEGNWLAQHPEDQVEIHFEIPELGISETVDHFRELSPMEELDFRQHARATYVIGDPIPEIYHPVWRDEAKMMNKEVAAESTKERSQ